MRRALAVVAALLLLAPAARAADTVHLGKAQGAAWTFLIADLGVEDGLFAKNGIDLQIVDLAGDAKVQQAFAAGSIEFGLGSGPGMAFSVKGSPAIAVAAFAGPPRNLAVSVLYESPIKSVADLKGKRISVSTVGSLTEWLAKQMSVAEGWGDNGVTTVPLGAMNSALAALIAGQVDAVLLATEAGFQLEDQHKGRVLVGMDLFAPEFITHVVYAQKTLVDGNPALVRRFLTAFFAAIALSHTDKAEMSKVAERVLHMSPASADRAYDYEEPIFSRDGVFDPNAVAVLKQSFVAMGTLPSPPADDQLFTTKFVPVEP